MKQKTKLRGIFSKFLNFFCALTIMIIVLFAIGAFIEADFRTKTIAGNYDAAIFSYIKHEDNRAELKAFGESITINLDKIDSAKEKLREFSANNRDYAPSFINLSGGIISSCFSSVIEEFMKIPGIISYFVNPAE